ncbi:ATP-binding protein [Sphingomonas sp. 37zxx]|uniref:ATP-binding protein n=1 Tax=Sphingomonas sp. 37zxx TaxID=1550073 RepID=UPI00053BDC46|nr:ATP-binding protein [Sphingomonas sp. 37zxx]
MAISVDMGVDDAGRPASIDLEELLATRLLVQGNSGSGKSHLLRRLLERSAPHVQQVIIDPEGDFVTLSERYGHVVVEAGEYSAAEILRFAGRCREHRASVVLSLEGLEAEGQMRTAAAFLGGLFDAPREHWYPALVVVDEAQVFAPAGGGEVAEEVRRASLGAMTNLMCRGRKRGLAGIIATQRLAKLAKNVAAEASNFLMGRTFLDIDMLRAADLLGMERKQADAIRDLARGSFLALGPAISRRPVSIRIGSVETGARAVAPKLTPLPTPSADMKQTLLEEPEQASLFLVSPPPPPPAPAESVLETLAKVDLPPPVEDDSPPVDVAAVVADVLRAIVAEPDAAARSATMLFQDFQVRCRMQGVHRSPLDASAFARRVAAARAGVYDCEGEEWAPAIRAARDLPDDMLGPYLAIARAARDGAPCPSDEELARVYGTTSLGRARRVIGYIEERQILVTRVDLSGKRSMTIPALGWTTLPAAA